jgi:predicted PurR-regulated permease PerM
MSDEALSSGGIVPPGEAMPPGEAVPPGETVSPGEAAALASEAKMDEAMATAAEVAEDGGLGSPGRPLNRRSPFFVGLTGAAGVAVAYAIVELIVGARSVLVLVGLGLFIAAGLDPVVTWLVRHGMPRWAAVVAVLVGAIVVAGGFLALAIPPLVSQTAELAKHLPNYAHTLQDHNSTIGKLNARYHIEKELKTLLSSKGSTLAEGVLGAGEVVLSTASSIFIVGVLSIYFLAGLPRIKLFAYRLVPHSRRPRAILIGDEILAKVGGYVLGNLITSLIAGIGTYLWMISLSIPYPVLLGLVVALLDLIPIIGSTIGGAIVTLVALTVSLPIAVATLCFYIAYRLAEDYLIVPRVIGRTVRVPAALTVVSLLVGGALLGIVGALVAIPVAAAVRLLVDEIGFRWLDRA